MSELVRIAMWSGPRNISTALMRAFGARTDCVVEDEPFYARYLALSGVQHPLQDKVLASQPHSASDVMQGLTRSLGPEIRVHYQKHMAHHMVGQFEIGWFVGFRHGFLVRDPAAMIASYRQKRESVCADDLGLARQRRIFEAIAERDGSAPPVVDATDVLRDPAAMLPVLCEALGVEPSATMLRWEPGLRPSDGVWAPHWYNAVAKSSGFQPYHEKRINLDPSELKVLDECRDDYGFFRRHRLTPA